nr:ABC transporter permease [Streptomyces sp. HNM0575]
MRARWRIFTHTPFFPATVLALIIAAAAGLFAGSYTYAMADPTPRNIPAAVQGDADDVRGVRPFIGALEKGLGSSLKIHRYRTFAQAEQAVEEQQVFAVLRPRAHGRVELGLSSAAGASVAEVLQQTAPKAGRKTGVEVTVRDLKPLGKGDPRGLTIFYMTLAADIIGFIGAIQLSVNVPDLRPLPRILFVAAYALLGGFVIAAMVGWLIGAVRLPFVHSWLILTLTMFTSAMVFLMFNTLIGRWAMIPTWLLMVLLGNPSSGGAVSWPLLPSALGTVGRWLPPGASVNAQHTAVYFPGNQHALPYLVLAAWALAGLAVFLRLDERLRRAPGR